MVLGPEGLMNMDINMIHAYDKYAQVWTHGYLDAWGWIQRGFGTICTGARTRTKHVQDSVRQRPNLHAINQASPFFKMPC
jgi:hypothetical protein